MNSNETKSNVRERMLTVRKQITAVERDMLNKTLVNKLIDWITRSQPFDSIFAYCSIRGEPDLMPCLREIDQAIPIGLPVVRDDQKMEFYRWDREEALVAGRYGIPEPSWANQTPMFPQARTLILVPAVAIDPDSYARLGYGGGFYDRYRRQHHLGLTLGVIWRSCLLRGLPTDPWDLILDDYLSD